MYKIPLLDLRPQWGSQKKEIKNIVSNVIESGNYILGEHVLCFEQEIASYCGQKYGIGVANGTDALVLILRALGIGPGDEVITSPFTFFATAEAILHVGAIPVFADIDEHTFNLDPSSVEERITSRTKALMPVHIFGQMADMSRFRELADQYGLFVVEDACQAIGATWAGNGVGHFADAAAFSFFPTKNLGTCGDGGMIVTNREDLKERLLRLRVHGSEKKYEHLELGWNSRLDEIHAAVLRLRLPHLDSWNEQRKLLAARYQDEFRETKLKPPFSHPQAGHVYHLFTVLIEERDRLQHELNRIGIGCGVYYPTPLHLQIAMSSLGYQKGDLPVVESISSRCLSLPLYPGMSINDQEIVIASIKQIL
ncbi:DegT/DnrJ/EryC1/StrS family aminotransferase [Paenibacillus sp. SYP-B3998]|uniref:DegT/DnrJ/EryC1/StrS family aminotransferase n=1 Tax=Paenibacillus sp. SYP-B3998 TaxID=2678564 RepID=A0A6G3ZSN0_9BACL|nr:DegT/DnrJ/EryC1/StrS family aminotransferase [Paenibacillus sp. SYP-B3998]NEW04427.1 DegT/DnrJ/EryC1/StrS family aminotransferase [Paenibacillus sp. SYP-B3998]